MTYETELISFSVPKIWSTVPQELEKCKSLDILKKKHKEMETTMLYGMMSVM